MKKGLTEEKGQRSRPQVRRKYLRKQVSQTQDAHKTKQDQNQNNNKKPENL